MHQRGRVESSVVFAPDCTLVYLLQVSIWVRSTEAVFHGNSIRVTVPRKLVAEWAESQQVSIVSTSSAGLRVLIEKASSVCTSRTSRISMPIHIR
jgi:hypothetical protein